MRKIIYYLGFLVSMYMVACSGEDDLTPSSLDKNWWVNIDNPADPLDHFIFEVYEKYKIPIFYTDTLGVREEQDAFGNSVVYYETIKLDYTILGGMSDAKVVEYSLSKNQDDITDGVEFLRDYVLPKLPDYVPAPRSYLLVDTLWQGLTSGQIRYSSAAYAGMTAVAVGKLSDIKKMTNSEKLLFGGEVLAAPVASDIYSDYKADLDAKFFKVLTQDVNQFYAYGQKVDINNTSKYNPYYAPCEDYGFLKPAQEKGIIEGSLYYFPSRNQDVNDYVALYLGFTEAQVQEIYGDKPHVLKKYGLIKEIIDRLK